MSSLRVDNISARTGNIVTIPGHIIQVVNTFYTTPTSLSIPASSSTYTDVPGISATITPRSAASKIYMTVRWFGEWNGTTLSWEAMFNIKRNGTPIGLPPQPGTSTLGIHMGSLSIYNSDADSTPETCFFDYYDSPATTSTLTYQLAIASATAGTMFINRCVNATATGSFERGTSSITLFEIAG